MSEDNEQKTEDTSTEDTSTADAKKEFSKKYIVLDHQIMWQDPATKFQLDWFNPEDGAWWAKTEDIPSAAVPQVRLSLRAGTLKLVDSYKKWAKSGKDDVVSKTSRRDKLVWTEIEENDVQANRRPPRNPSIAKGTLTYGDQKSKAYQVLQKTAAELKNELPKIVTAMTEKNAEAFLREAVDLEKRGYNRALHARDSVIDTLKQILIGMGFNSGITRVKDEDEEPITKDSKPVRFAL